MLELAQVLFLFSGWTVFAVYYHYRQWDDERRESREAIDNLTERKPTPLYIDGTPYNLPSNVTRFPQHTNKA